MQLIGLLSVGGQLLHQLNTVDQAMCKLLGVLPDDSGYSGHVGDTLYEADTHNPVHLATGLLHRLGIEVAEEPLAPEGDVTGPDPASLPYRVRIDLPAGYTPTPPREEPPF